MSSAPAGWVAARTLLSLPLALHLPPLAPQNLSRKLVHTTAGPLLLLAWPLFSADPSARYAAPAALATMATAQPTPSACTVTYRPLHV